MDREDLFDLYKRYGYVYEIYETCGFDRDPENIPISEGDVINIRTEKDYTRNYEGVDIPISYLFTFMKHAGLIVIRKIYRSQRVML